MFSIPVYFLDILYVGIGRAAHEAVMYTRIHSLSCFKGNEVDFQINYIKDEFLFDHVFYTTSMEFMYDNAFFPRSLSNDPFIFFRVSIVIIYYFNYPLLFLYNHNETNITQSCNSFINVAHDSHLVSIS